MSVARLAPKGKGLGLRAARVFIILPMDRAPLRIGAWQFSPQRGDVAANLAEVERGLAAACDAGLSLLVLPEMWPTSFLEGAGPFGESDALERAFRESDEALEHLRVQSSHHHLAVAGTAYGPPDASGRRPNRLFVFDRGREVLRQDKVHLFSPTGEPFAFAAGQTPPAVVDATFGRIGGLVCYDLRFPMLAEVLGREAPDVVVVPAQWPVARGRHWRALLLGRAVELQAFVVGANRTGTETVGRRGQELIFPGNSLVASPEGLVLAEGRGEPGLVWAEVDPGLLVRLRREVPIGRDRRPDFYRGLGSGTEGRDAPPVG